LTGIINLVNKLIEFINIFVHLDKYISVATQSMGNWIYILLFVIIFAETGFVVTPFLPGDSLLFVAGTLAGAGLINITALYIALLSASILGDTANYWLGHYIGKKVFQNENSKFFKKEYLEKTREFYVKNGSRSIILARFIPIIRTFAPFVAGIGKMHYRTFITYNIIGAIIWVTLITYAGYFFGGLDIIKRNFHYVTLIIIFVSFIPIMLEYFKHQKNKLTKSQLEHANYKEIIKAVEETEE